MQSFLWGLGVGCVLLIVVSIIQAAKSHAKIKAAQADVERYKKMLTDRMEIESQGLAKLKEENESLKKQVENLRITVNTYSQKPGRKEVERLQVYQKAVDRLTLNSPGFGAAWQAALKESEEEFRKTYLGTQAFIRRLIPFKTDAEVLATPDEDEKN